ncbi:winged helix DNA-binding domain-containing protein [Pseudarthrobacter sp. NamE5]|uniref:winged helix DNA-binding domain-containing protein n=1 Tax=Pseudarthrobacter sp. NamE5 TaxID=2576839 RepID=UPI00110BE8EB|nr:winged helix DNA-binding domain-containing protein [Pseudarthrobacter sp. NamE5]TLM85843.1 winged helix DNA-binding domain-containing protein [Pseudarthrobacter sp. NamE5]
MTGKRLTGAVLGRLRLVSQRLVPAPVVPPVGRAADVQSAIAGTVRWMTALQAQDLPAAMWAVGTRVPGAGLSDVRAALDSGAVVRSWPMRGTLHLVAPEDLGWMLQLTAERLTKGIASRHRELGITWADIEKCRDIALDHLAGGTAAGRQELFRIFDAAGQPTQGQRGIHILGTLCRHGWLVLGPLSGNQQLFAAFDDWIRVSRCLERREGVAEFALRYFRSHGPATVRDFAWWTQISLTEVRAAFEDVKDQLVELEFKGTSYWLSPETGALLNGSVPGSRSVLLLPGFDEFLLGYQDRSLVLAVEHANRIVPGGNGVFKKTLVAGGEVIGTWAREGTGPGAGVVPELFDGARPLGATARSAFDRAAGRYLAFLQS